MYCECGCGEKTRIATENRPKRGWVKGKPLRYIDTHGSRKPIVAVVDEATRCWILEGRKDSNGYGQVMMGGKMRPVHRLTYEALIGTYPADLDLDHKVCQTPACVNPWHLEPVTTAVNVQRGRLSKLTPDEVLEIRAIPREVPASHVAARFSISKSNVIQIRNGTTWKNLLGGATCPL